MITANSTWLRGNAALPAAFLAELVAQAAAILLVDPAAGPQQRWLAGIDRLEMHRRFTPATCSRSKWSPGDASAMRCASKE